MKLTKNLKNIFLIFYVRNVRSKMEYFIFRKKDQSKQANIACLFVFVDTL